MIVSGLLEMSAIGTDLMFHLVFDYLCALPFLIFALALLSANHQQRALRLRDPAE